jgi:drug/metabolite transporter (DMT)-like permease
VPLFVWGGVAYLAVFTTIVTFFLTQYAVPFLGSTRVMAYSYLYPGLVLIIDLALGHGLPPARVIPGVLVVLVAMVVLQNTREQS